MKQRVAILFGGRSSEYTVSLQSAAAVVRAVDTERYEPVLIGITRQGCWLQTSATADEIESDRWQDAPTVAAFISPSREGGGLWLMGPYEPRRLPLDMAFPVLHGKYGEDGTLQGLLEMAGIPIVGCGTLASALCMDKDAAHRLAASAGVDCPPSFALRRDEWLSPGGGARLRAGLQSLAPPFFVKPAAEGSSFGVSRVEQPELLTTAIETAFDFGEKVVVEQGVDGIELGVALLGDEDPLAGCVDAIQLAEGFFDFHEKYSLETAQILLPAPIPEEAAQRAVAMAKQLYRLFGCRGFARVDLFLTQDNRLLFNEINTIPGMTAHSRYPGMLGAAGINFPDMVARMLRGAVPS